MIGVGFKNHKKITLEASYDNSELDTAVATGEALACHSRGEIIVFLYHKGKPKVKILRRIKAVRAGFLWLRKKVVTV